MWTEALGWLTNGWLAQFLSGFKFDSNFTLFFDRQSESFFDGMSLPWQLKLEVLEDWRFGGQEEWTNKVAEFGVGAEPDEPVKAFELTKLRWIDESVIESVEADEAKLSIFFRNGAVIHVIVTEEDEFTYSLSRNSEMRDDTFLSVTLDGQGFYLKA